MNTILAQSGWITPTWEWAFFTVAVILLCGGGILLIYFGQIYLRALLSGAKVTLTELIALRLRRIPLALVLTLCMVANLRMTARYTWAWSEPGWTWAQLSAEWRALF